MQGISRLARQHAIKQPTSDHPVIPAEAGIQKAAVVSIAAFLDTGLRRYDECPVIPADAGIQKAAVVSIAASLDTGLRRYDECPVAPAQAGAQGLDVALDSGIRRNDGSGAGMTMNEAGVIECRNPNRGFQHE